MNTPPTPNVRLTISVSPEVHETFQRLSSAAGKSIGRSMGDWLGDTLDAAEYLASTMERAREAPKLVIQELQAYTLGISEHLDTVMERVRRKGEDDRRSRAAGEGPRLRGEALAAVRSPLPPSGNTGGKGPLKRAVGPARVQAYADTNGVPPRSK